MLVGDSQWRLSFVHITTDANDKCYQLPPIYQCYRNSADVAVYFPALANKMEVSGAIVCVMSTIYKQQSFDALSLHAVFVLHNDFVFVSEKSNESAIH